MSYTLRRMILTPKYRVLKVYPNACVIRCGRKAWIITIKAHTRSQVKKLKRHVTAQKAWASAAEIIKEKHHG